MQNNVVDEIREKKIIAIVRGVEKSKLLPLAEALFDGGISLMEITYSANGSVSDEETADAIKLLAKKSDGKMHIGAGTVLTQEQVKRTYDAGGSFVISPNTDIGIIKYTKQLGMVSIPGAMTPSEAVTAKCAGADFVKLFPVTSLGVGYVKAISAPLSHIPFLAVGGITPENIGEYLNAGVCGFGVGSNITNKTFIANQEFEKITALAKKYVDAVKNV